MDYRFVSLPVMESHTVYLGIGANLGERAANLEEARRQIEARVGPVREASRVYRTEAWGIEDQPDFYNQVLQVDTMLTPEVLLDTLLAIEQAMGRVREGKWRRRLIDIDILFFEDRVIQSSRLVVPHPFLHQRRFVLAPLAEIAPNLRHPLLHKTVAELVGELEDPLAVEPLTADH